MKNDKNETLPSRTRAATEKGAERVRQILVAAKLLYASEGYAGLSMRAVATHVGISLGNLQHYFPNKDALIAAVLNYMMDTYQVEIDNVISRDVTRDDQVVRFVNALDLLLERVGSPEAQSIFFETWSLATRSQAAFEIVNETYRREELALFNLLRALPTAGTRKEVKLKAQASVLLIHGCMVGLSQIQRGLTKSETTSRDLEKAVRRQILAIAGVA